MRQLCSLFIALPLAAQTVQYEVSVPTPAARLFHIAAEFPTRGQDTLFLSLPAWSPGNYEIQNYARYVRHFGAKTPAGQALFWDRSDKSTWRVATGKSDRVTAEFDYLADTIDLSMARIAGDFGQFLGTNVFLYEDGQLARPAEVRFTLPAGWQVATALKQSGAGTGASYGASNYHELADAETFVGKFSLDSLQVGGKWIRLAVWPSDAYTAPVARTMRSDVAKIVETETRTMGQAPYERYTIFFNVIREPIGFGGGLEHSGSQFDIMPASAFADATGTLGDFMVPLMSHEFFHLWNVKRIRPAELWPYGYRAEQYTPLLWWSEGVTDYYADLTNLRSGLWTPQQFLANAAGDMRTVESAPEPWSEEDGSIATWINEVFVNSSQLYYPKGALTGMLLDIALRDATDNAHGLDDVMRALYTRHYERGTGFTTRDLLGLLREFGLPNADDFYHRYINGRDPLPYQALFPKAGLVVQQRTESTPFLGVSAPLTEHGQWVVQAVTPGTAADRAGLLPGDTLVKVGEVATPGPADWSPQFRERYRGQAGAPLTITVRRGAETLTLVTEVRERTLTVIDLSLQPSPAAKQAAIWRGLATGSTGR